MAYGRDYIRIRENDVLHATARRDWVCGACGSRLITIWREDAPHWHTVCAKNADHEPDSFVHKGTWEYLEHHRLTEAAQAEDVLAHLPADLQAAILATE